MTSRPPPLLIVTEVAPGSATWAEAKRLVAEVRAGGRAWLELGEVLEILREEFFGEGHGGVRPGAGRPSDWEKANRKNNQAPHGAALDSTVSEKGWQAKVREELGISDDTARRWMLDGQRYRQMRLICAGKVDEVDGHLVTDAVRQEARSAVNAIDADPTVRPARRWAGLWGALPTKGTQRQAVDHARNLRRALIALANSLEYWAKISPTERARIEAGWAELVAAGLIPSTWRRL